MKRRLIRAAVAPVAVCLVFLGLWGLTKLVHRLDEIDAANSGRPVRREPEEPPRPEDLIVVVPSHDYVPSGGGLLERELLRQAVLIAARDELGLRTRDGDLREVDPEEPPVRLRAVKVSVGPAAGVVEAAVLRYDDVKPKLAGRVTVASEGPLGRIPRLAQEAERLSRKDFVRLLEAAGFRKAAAESGPESAPSDPPAALTERLDAISQFAAVRAWHAALRGGATPARVAGLARAYANLGVLTEHHWSPASKSYRARSLLYAERLLHLTGRTPAALRVRSYARLLAGLPAAALADLDEARAIAGTADGEQNRPKSGRRVPGWAAVLEARCRGDDEALERQCNQAAATSDRVLARLLRLVEAEAAGLPRALQAAAESVLKIEPACARASDVLLGTDMPLDTAVAYQHATLRGSSNWLYEPLVRGGFPIDVDLIASRRDEESERRLRGQIVDDLLSDARFRDDRGEPSLVAFGRLIEDEGFYQAWRVVDIERNVLGSEADDLVARTKPWAGRHRLWPFVESHVSEAEGAALGSLVERLPKEVLVPAMWPMRDRLVARSAGWFGSEDRRLLANRDEVVGDLRWWLGRPLEPIERRLFARRLERVDPHSTATAMRLLLDDAGPAASRTRAQDERLERSPAFSAALAERHVEEMNYDEASRLLRRAAEASGESNLFRRLAEVRLAAGDEEGYLAAMKECLELPDLGLEHATASERIARRLMRRGRWEEARPYAERAAASYAGWGLLCAADCLERLGDFDGAERLHKAESERYFDAAANWYLWCLRTGRGDSAAARRAAEPAVARWNRAAGPYQTADLRNLAVLDAVEGRREAALDRLENLSAISAEGFDALLTALSADELGRDDLRGKYLAAARDRGDRTDLSVGVLARAFLADLAGNTLDPAALRPKLLQVISSPGEFTNSEYFLARFLENRGRADEALSLYASAAASPRTEKLSVILAALAARRLGGVVPQRRLDEIDEGVSAALERLAAAEGYLGRGRYGAALRRLDGVLGRLPGNVAALRDRSEALLAEDRAAEAFADIDAAVAAVPGNLDLRFRRGRVLECLGRNWEAAGEYGAILLAGPTFEEANDAHARLCWLFASCADPSFRDPAAAARHRSAMRPSDDISKPTHPDEYHTLERAEAVVEAAEGRFDDAVRTAEAVMPETPESVRPALEYQLSCYRAGRPYVRPQKWWLLFDGDGVPPEPSAPDADGAASEDPPDRPPIEAPRPQSK